MPLLTSSGKWKIDPDHGALQIVEPGITFLKRCIKK